MWKTHFSYDIKYLIIFVVTPPCISTIFTLQIRRRTRHLGALDDWGLGILEALDDGSGARGSYEVTATHVTVAAWSKKVVGMRDLLWCNHHF